MIYTTRGFEERYLHEKRNYETNPYIEFMIYTTGEYKH